jgi:hypothetical protein
MEQLVESWTRKVRRAVKRGDWAHVKRLVTAAATTGSAAEVSSTAVLHSAICCRPRFGFPPNSAGWEKYQAERTDLVRFLLLAGAPLDAQDKWGMTPLHRAVIIDRDNNKEVVQQLLSAGASVQDMSSAGLTALHYAAQRGCADICINAVHSCFRQAQTWQLLIINQAGGFTPLSYHSWAAAVLHPHPRAGADVPGLFGMLFAGASVSELNVFD